MTKPKTDDTEAKATTVQIVFDGETYDVLADDLDEIGILDDLSQGRLPKVARYLLGGEQFARFRADHRKIDDLNRFFKSALPEVGLGNL